MNASTAASTQKSSSLVISLFLLFLSCCLSLCIVGSVGSCGSTILVVHGEGNAERFNGENIFLFATHSLAPNLVNSLSLTCSACLGFYLLTCSSNIKGNSHVTHTHIHIYQKCVLFICILLGTTTNQLVIGVTESFNDYGPLSVRLAPA